jgi:hypothetical protein
MNFLELPVVTYEVLESGGEFQGIDGEGNIITAEESYVEDSITLKYINLNQIVYLEPSLNNEEYTTLLISIDLGTCIDVALEYDELVNMMSASQALHGLDELISELSEEPLDNDAVL